VPPEGSQHALELFGAATRVPDQQIDPVEGALLIAQAEYPDLDRAAYRQRLEELGREARQFCGDRAGQAGEQLARLSRLFSECWGFRGNREDYYDPRNSFLNDVLDRRTGIPITLALLYMEVARRAGLYVEGINFPGHFLVRCPAPRGLQDSDDLIIDAFHGGALLSEDACRELLRRHAGEDAVFDPHVLGNATKPQILVRVLLNLKRVYVRMHSFPQARDITELMLAVNPSAVTELRDRGLLAYHLKDFSAALRDLQAYLLLVPSGSMDEDEREEHEQIWEHIKTLRRRVASLN